MMSESQEFERARADYEARDAAMPAEEWRENIYHPRHSIGSYFSMHNRLALTRALNVLDIDLTRERVLDVGCGRGAWLRTLVELGSHPGSLTGVDLSESRIEYARASNPGIEWVHYDGGPLPFSDEAFTFVMQVVVFSSVLDEGVRSALAAEMLRVTAPGGHILWIDLKTSTPGTLEGFSEDRVLGYFPGCREVYRDDVHPSYARRLSKEVGGLEAALTGLRYALSRGQCESTLMVLQKGRA